MKRVFEWDERKAAINQRVHGVSFQDARLVFDDPRHTIDVNLLGGELRLDAIGRVDGKEILVVIHMVIDEDTEREVTRIISARQAVARERASVLGR